MIFLKMFSFMAGSFVLLAAPFVLLTERQAASPPGGWLMAAGLLAVLLFSLAYFFFALLAHRMARSLPLRRAGAALIGFQLLAGIVLLATAGHTQAPLAVAPLLCFSVCLFMACVWPGISGRAHRPMRRRAGEHISSS